MDPVIIIGTGIAGYTLAREFRKLDTESPLLLISADDGASYPKPMLSNALTKGKTPEQLAMFSAEAMSEKLDAQILSFTKVVEIDESHHTITTSRGEKLSYSQLVLALGANAVRIPMDGDAVDDVLSVNDLTDYSVFRDKLLTAKHVAIIGPGLIGCEFANDLLNTGSEVSIIGPSSYPIQNLLPPVVGEQLAENLTKLGANWQLNTTTKSINKNADNSYQLELTNGEIIHADVVLSAVGLRAHTDLAKQTGLTVNRGIVTDIMLKTSADDIYAIGDCAEVAGHNLLFIAPITAAAKSLALTLSGSPTSVSYPAMPVTIKTPCYPLVVAPPTPGLEGEWHYEPIESGFGLRALFKDDQGDLLGFVLSGDAVGEKRVYGEQLADIL